MANHDEDLTMNPNTRPRLERALDAWSQKNALSPLQAIAIRENAVGVAVRSSAQLPSARDAQAIEPLDKLPALVFANFKTLDAKLSKFVPGWPAGLGPTHSFA